MDEISIIVPVYNVCKYLDKCLKAILGQSYRYIKVIIINDCSTDGSGKICNKYASDSRVTIIHLSARGGVSNARNVGLALVTTDYITFVDPDDYISKTHIEELYSSLKKYNADISICGYAFVDGKENIHKEVIPDSGKMTIGTKEALGLLCNNTIESYLWNKLFKTSCFDGIIFPLGKEYEDIYVMYFVFKRAGIFSFTNKVGYFYLMRSGSIIHSKSTYIAAFSAAYSRYVSILSDTDIDDNLRKQCRKGVLESCANSAYYSIYYAGYNKNMPEMKMATEFWDKHKKEISRISRKFWLKCLCPKFYAVLLKIKDRQYLFMGESNGS